MNKRFNKRNYALKVINNETVWVCDSYFLHNIHDINHFEI